MDFKDFDLVKAFLILVLCIFLIIAYLWIKHNTDSKTSFLKKMWFLFRWFLIGKYHCEVSQSQKAFLKALNKVLWGGVIIGWALLLGDIVKRFL